MSLNAEPADPQERQEHHLPPKSFADAAHEAIDHNGHDPINEDSIKETPPTRKLSRKGSIEPRPLQEMLDEEEKQPSLPSTPVQPRRTRSTKQQEKSWADMAEEGVNTAAHPIIDLHAGEGHEAHADGEEFTGQGRNESPRSPAQINRPHKRTSSIRSAKSTSPMMTVSEGSDGQQQKPVYEKFESPDGKQLTSVKPDDSYDDALKLDEKELPQKKEEQPKHSKDELVSGRRAGAGWESSAYVLASTIIHSPLLTHVTALDGHHSTFLSSVAFKQEWSLSTP
jgi:2-acylglycerol O-acyltransferase 2